MLNSIPFEIFLANELYLRTRRAHCVIYKALCNYMFHKILEKVLRLAKHGIP